MPYGMQIFIFSYVFVTALGMLLGELGLASFTFITPTIFAIGNGLVAIAIAAGNTPVAKGVAVAAWAVWIFLYLFSLNIPMYGGIIFAIILAPTFIGIAMLLLEVSRG